MWGAFQRLRRDILNEADQPYDPNGDHVRALLVAILAGLLERPWIAVVVLLSLFGLGALSGYDVR